MNSWMVDKKTAGVVGVVAVVAALAGFGGGRTLTPTQFRNAYVCPQSGEVGIFPLGLSDSGKTGYYMVNGTEKGERCNVGRNYYSWVPLEEYAKKKGVDINEILKGRNITEIPIKGRQGTYNCKLKGGAISAYSRCYENGTFKVYAGELINPPPE